MMILVKCTDILETVSYGEMLYRTNHRTGVEYLDVGMKPTEFSDRILMETLRLVDNYPDGEPTKVGLVSSPQEEKTDYLINHLAKRLYQGFGVESHGLSVADLSEDMDVWDAITFLGIPARAWSPEVSIGIPDSLDEWEGYKVQVFSVARLRWVVSLPLEARRGANPSWFQAVKENRLRGEVFTQAIEAWNNKNNQDPARLLPMREGSPIQDIIQLYAKFQQRTDQGTQAYQDAYTKLRRRLRAYREDHPAEWYEKAVAIIEREASKLCGTYKEIPKPRPE